jgi:hypothetical protein
VGWAFSSFVFHNPFKLPKDVFFKKIRWKQVKDSGAENNIEKFVGKRKFLIDVKRSY